MFSARLNMENILLVRQDFLVYFHLTFALVKISKIISHSWNKFHIGRQTIEYPLYMYIHEFGCMMYEEMKRVTLCMTFWHFLFILGNSSWLLLTSPSVMMNETARVKLICEASRNFEFLICYIFISKFWRRIYDRLMRGYR